MSLTMATRKRSIVGSVKLTGARDVWRRSPAARAGVFAVALIVVAEGAVFLLSPGEEGIPPVDVAEGEYLDPAEVARAVDYRDGQRNLLVLVVQAQQGLLQGQQVDVRRVRIRLLRRELIEREH